MIPRIPLFEDSDPRPLGTHVPRAIRSGIRPASGLMPPPALENRKVLGEMLVATFRRNMNTITKPQIRHTVNSFIAQAETAERTRVNRLSELEGKMAQGGGNMIRSDLERYRRAEREYFFGDSTCLLRYVGG